MARHKRLGEPRRLQTRLGQAEGKTAGLRATVGTHRNRNSGRYRAQAERKDNECNKDFEQRETPLAVTPGGKIKRRN
jgi:hypothetical protein